MFDKVYVVPEFKSKFSNKELNELLDFSVLKKQDLLIKKSRFVNCAVAHFLFGSYFFKQVVSRNNINLISRLIRPSRPFHNLIISNRLLKNGIPTPKIVAISRQIVSGLNLSDYLVSEAFPKEAEADFWVPKMINNGELNLMIQKLCLLLFKMAQIGIEHSDLKLGNIFKLPTENKFGYTFGVFDLDGCKSWWPASVPTIRLNKCLAKQISSLRAYAVTHNLKIPNKSELVKLWVKTYNEISNTQINHKIIENITE